MAPTIPDSITKNWLSQQIRHAKSLKTEAEKERFWDKILEGLEEDTKPKTFTASDMDFDQVLEIFDLKDGGEWDLRLREEIYEPPKYLINNLMRLKMANYEEGTEAYGRIATNYMIVACMVEYKILLSKQSELPNDPATTISCEIEQYKRPTNDLHNQTTVIVPIVDQATEIAGPANIAPATSSMAPTSTFQPLPLKVFTEMGLSVRVLKSGHEWTISGIADWAIGYGKRAKLDDGIVLLAVEAKQSDTILNAQAQLLAYLATIRQLRIQANKKNVIIQGLYSDGVNYRFLCIHNDGTVMRTDIFDTSLRGRLRSVFNFLLGMLITAAESSTNTSPTKKGEQQDKRIENFDREVFVEVFEDTCADEISGPTAYHIQTQDGEELRNITFVEL